MIESMKPKVDSLKRSTKLKKLLARLTKNRREKTHTKISKL